MKPKLKKYVSIFSLLISFLLLILFSLALPEILLSSAGRLFAICWSLIAIFVVLAHTKNISRREWRAPKLIARKPKSTAPNKMYRTMN